MSQKRKTDLQVEEQLKWIRVELKSIKPKTLHAHGLYREIAMLEWVQGKGEK